MSAAGPDKSLTGQVLKTHVDTLNPRPENAGVFKQRLNRAERRALKKGKKK